MPTRGHPHLHWNLSTNLETDIQPDPRPQLKPLGCSPQCQQTLTVYGVLRGLSPET